MNENAIDSEKASNPVADRVPVPLFALNRQQCFHPRGNVAPHWEHY